MTFTGEQLEVTAQLGRAREKLGEALGQTQDIANSGLDVDHISAALAAAVKSIFTVQSVGIMEQGNHVVIVGAMDHLSNTLELLQEVQDNSPALEKITGTTARILALLYPVAKVFEMIAKTRAETETEDEPIPLVSEAPKSPARLSEAPIPLVGGTDGRRRSQIPRQASSMPPDSVERRTLDRRSIEVDIGIHSNTNFFTGFSQDISAGGIFIATFDVLNIGKQLNVNFTVPEGPVLSVDGVVRWVREYNESNPEVEPGMGVQFEKLGVDDKLAINSFMEKKPPIFYDDE